MRVDDWVNTPQGIGKVSSFSNSYTRDKVNVYVLLDKQLYAFAIGLVTPIDPAVSNILIAVNN
jgi:hypothetical protein